MEKDGRKPETWLVAAWHVVEPSKADELLTVKLKDALALVDIRVLDHVIVAGSDSISLAERG